MNMWASHNPTARTPFAPLPSEPSKEDRYMDLAAKARKEADEIEARGIELLRQNDAERAELDRFVAHKAQIMAQLSALAYELDEIATGETADPEACATRSMELRGILNRVRGTAA